MSDGVDLFVIGAGSGGVRAARMAAAAGARVAIAEERRLGGTCVNVGCIPKKLMVYASHVREEREDAAGFGWSLPEGSFSWPALIAAKDREISRLNGVYRRLLEAAGVEILEARARLDGEKRVVAAGRAIRAERIVLATGGRPCRPDFEGAELALISDDVFQLPSQPRSLVVLGGGYIAVEFAGIFHGLGTEVTLVYRGDLFLQGFDCESRETLADALRAKGIRLVFGARAQRLSKQADGCRLELDNGAVLESEQVLLATGRSPNTAHLGLAKAGVEVDDLGAVIVDEYSRSSRPDIYAIGDCTNRMNLTPVAIAEAMALVRTVFEGRPTAMSYDDVPTAVFGQPCLSSVGLTEEQARERWSRVEIYRSSFLPLKHTLSGRPERTLVKLVVEPVSDRVVGAHMVGPDAAEIVQGLAIAMKAGATKSDFDATIGVHPTSAEEFVTLRQPS